MLKTNCTKERRKGGDVGDVRDLERLLGAKNLNEDVGDYLHQ